MMREFAVWFIVATGVLTGINTGQAGEWKCNGPGTGGGDYVYGYAHEVPGTYVYRTSQAPVEDRASSLGGESRGTGFAALFGFGKGGGQPMVDQGLALKLRVAELGRDLLAHAKEAVVDEYVITVSTFVNLNHLYRTSSLGRYLGEQLITELQQAGLEILEIRKAPSILMSEEFGEYSLSRDMKELDFVHDARATVAGTYIFSNGKLFVNARLLRNSDGMVLSTASQVMDMDNVVCGLLADEGMPRKTGGLVKLGKNRESQAMVAGTKASGGPNP